MSNSSVNNSSNGVNHILFIVHGILGKPEAMEHLKYNANKRALNSHIHVIESNATTRENMGATLDGVDRGGERAANEIKMVVAKLSMSMELEYISILGFSLGGLYSRYACAVLFDNEAKTIAGLKPLAFTTVASPHLGVKAFNKGWFSEWLRSKSAALNGRTVKHMFLEQPIDEVEEGKDSTTSSSAEYVPLLLQMTRKDQHLPFFESLDSFKYHRVYANMENDLAVPFQTGLIVSCPPESVQSTPEFKVDETLFPSIVKLSTSRLPMASNAPSFLTELPAEECTVMQEMITNLSEIVFERVIVQISMCNAHNCIIGNGKFFNKNKGKDVARHVGIFLFQCTKALQN